MTNSPINNYINRIGLNLNKRVSEALQLRKYIRRGVKIKCNLIENSQIYSNEKIKKRYKKPAKNTKTKKD